MKRLQRHTIGGEPATIVQLLVTADYLDGPLPAYAPGPHFCPRCGQPLDGTPCYVCAKVRCEKAEELRGEVAALLAPSTRDPSKNLADFAARKKQTRTVLNGGPPGGEPQPPFVLVEKGRRR
jgi:hypothetical protein